MTPVARKTKDTEFSFRARRLAAVEGIPIGEAQSRIAKEHPELALSASLSSVRNRHNGAGADAGTESEKNESILCEDCNGFGMRGQGKNRVTCKTCGGSGRKSEDASAHLASKIFDGYVARVQKADQGGLASMTFDGIARAQQQGLIAFGVANAELQRRRARRRGRAPGAFSEVARARLFPKEAAWRPFERKAARR